MIALDAAMDELRRTFSVPEGSLDRCEDILHVQHLSLSRHPPLARLSDAVRLAASARLRAGEPIMARERVPLEVARVAEVLRALARTLMDEPGALDLGAREWVEAALPAATADDAAGVHHAAARLGLPVDSAVSLLREALKPEMLRTSAAFIALVQPEAPRRRCPLCDALPAAATDRHEACCRWCGLIFPWDASACGACGQAAWRPREVPALARDAQLMQCLSCGEVAKIFHASADPLVLSLHAVLIAPLELAARVGAQGRPSPGFSIF